MQFIERDLNIRDVILKELNLMVSGKKRALYSISHTGLTANTAACRTNAPNKITMGIMSVLPTSYGVSKST